MSPAIISTDLLQKTAGKETFQRAKENARKVNIAKFQFNGKQASADIDTYHVTVRYLGETIEGACNCEESDGFDFCQHCVALVLHANKRAQQLLSLSKGPDKSKVFAYLMSLDKQELAKQFLNLLEQDTEQFQRFLLKASLGAGQIDFAKLKTQVTEITRSKERLFSQRQVKHFFSRIEQFLEELSLSEFDHDVERMLKIVEYVFQRLNILFDRLDPRTEHKHRSLSILNTMYSQLFAKLGGRDSTRAKRFYALWLVDKHQLLSADVQTSMDPACLDAFQREVLSQWRQHMGKPALAPWQQRRLAECLRDHKAELTLNESQAVRQVLAENDRDHLNIAQHWFDANEHGKAISVLEKQLPQADEPQRLLEPLGKHYLQRNADEAFLKLFARYSELMSPLLLEVSNDITTRISQQCIDILRDQHSIAEQTLLLKLYVDASRYAEAATLIEQGNLELQERIDYCHIIGGHAPDIYPRLVLQLIEELLMKQRSKTDKQAAQLLVELESRLNEKSTVTHFLDAKQPLFHSRPQFIQHYHSLLQSR